MSTPARYRKKPVEITAVQVCWANWHDVTELLGDALSAENPGGARRITGDEASDTCGEFETSNSAPGQRDYIAFDVRTAHGEIAVVRHGDWIVPEAIPGRFYPVKPDVFAATYEPVEGT
jgi:hypothetical protein